MYEQSNVSLLCKEILGGNSHCIGIFNVRMGDPMGSFATLNALRDCRRLNNFPILNHQNAIGLLRIMRREIKLLKSSIEMKDLGGIDSKQEYMIKLAELEKKMIEENLSNAKYGGDKQRYVLEVKELKEKFNSLGYIYIYYIYSKK